MTELKIIVQITIMGIIISTILLPIFYPDLWNINKQFILSVLTWSYFLGFFCFLLKETYKNGK